MRGGKIKSILSLNTYIGHWLTHSYLRLCCLSSFISEYNIDFLLLYAYLLNVKKSIVHKTTMKNFHMNFHHIYLNIHSIMQNHILSFEFEETKQRKARKKQWKEPHVSIK